ncbi:MAG: MMPL family transporter [Saccharothrix sp.]|nr:MMPL family transporter [Saccharothrix sp.]
MATFLYRLGRAAFRRRWVVALGWLAIVGVAAIGAGLGGGMSGDNGSAPGTEAQAALELARDRFPALDPSRATARVVFVAPAGERITDKRATVDRLVAAVSNDTQVAAVVGPFSSGAVSPDGSTAYVTVGYTSAAGDLTTATKDRLRDAVVVARADGVAVEVGGPVLAEKPGVGGVSEVVGIALAGLVLLVVFGSVVAAGLPLVTALLGVGVSMLTITALGAAFGFSTTTSVVAVMLGLAVGIDYALFIVSRYREERAHGHPAEEAAGLAVGTAGSAVVFAGVTVVITLVGLPLTGIPIAAKIGVSAAFAVCVAILVALTLVPALLGFAPRAVLARRVRTGRVRAEKGTAARWARFVLRRRLPMFFGTTAVLVLLALPVLHLNLGTPDDGNKSAASTERRAYDALAGAFGPGINGPLTIVVDARTTADPEAAVRAVAAKIADTPGVLSVSPANYDDPGDTALFTAVPATAPNDERTKDLVHRIRAERSATESATGATVLVSGATAVNIDLADQVPGKLVRYLTIVLGLAFLLLLTVFRSPIVPLEAVFGFLLSTLATLGAVVAVFQWGWGAGLIGLDQTGPIISTMPIMLVGMIFGLAMDYEVFVVSRIREARTNGEPAERAVVTGFRRSARIVVAAALIMVSVFAGFVAADQALIKMIGFSLATAVLLDAFVVRMVLVPALLALTGELAWSLPRWLDRLLPHVDVEGHALVREDGAGPDEAGDRHRMASVRE